MGILLLGTFIVGWYRALGDEEGLGGGRSVDLVATKEREENGKARYAAKRAWEGTLGYESWKSPNSPVQALISLVWSVGVPELSISL